MVAHEVFAMIYDETIQNVCVAFNYEDANRVARAVYGNDAIAVECLQYPCEIGDKYIDGMFYKADGVTPIEYIPTQEQQVKQLQQENAELTIALADVIGGVMS
nr:MAG TPA: hypothetical protein [Caudoviricetes sp.]